MCIYYHQLTQEQQRTLASIFADPSTTHLSWSSVLDLFRSLKQVQKVRELNGKIGVVWLDCDQVTHVDFFNRPRREKFVNSCQVRQIREFLDRLQINREEE